VTIVETSEIMSRINLSSFKLFLSGICLNDGNLTSTPILEMRKVKLRVAQGYKVEKQKLNDKLLSMTSEQLVCALCE
jgi:hypothetical protein